MTLCQPESVNVSCGSCCGLFNLQLVQSEFVKLLLDRTTEFLISVNYSIQHTIPAYRQSREQKEYHIPKKDISTYNCPYLGYLEGTSGRIGCMIHPNRTGNPKSQNYSFYGASICLGYECKNRERHTESFWIEFFTKISKDSLEYSQHSANHPWVRRIENSLGIPSNLLKDQSNKESIIKSLKILYSSEDYISEVWCALYKYTSANTMHLTSFEVDYESSESKDESTRILSELLN